MCRVLDDKLVDVLMLLSFRTACRPGVLAPSVTRRQERTNELNVLKSLRPGWQATRGKNLQELSEMPHEQMICLERSPQV